MPPTNVKRLKLLMYACILIFLGIALSVDKCSAQSKKNTIFVTFQPEDLGLGVRYDRDFRGIGVFASGSYGNFNKPYVVKIKNHIKIGAGISIPSWHDTYLVLGTSYHLFGKVTELGNDFNDRILFPMSVDIGMKVVIDGWIVPGFRFDWPRGESSFEIGIKF